MSHKKFELRQLVVLSCIIAVCVAKAEVPTMNFCYLLDALFVGATSLGAKTEYAEKEYVEKLSSEVASMWKDLQGIMELLKTDQKLEQLSRKEEMRSEGKLAADLKNDSSLEERVATLEAQIISVNEELVNINGNVEDLAQQVEISKTEIVLIKSDQVLQDQKILELEDDAEIMATNIEMLEDSVTSFDIVLNSSISDVNSEISQLSGSIDNLGESVTSLEERDDELEADLETLAGSLTDLSNTVADIGSGVDNLDSRISRIEVSGSVAFHAYLGTYTSLTIGSPVVFDVRLNQGGGYSSSTGQFTVPSDGAGIYYISTHFQLQDGMYAGFSMYHNSAVICGIYEDESLGGDQPSTSCGVTVNLQEG